MIVLLGAMGLLLGVAAKSGQSAAAGGRNLKAIDGGRDERKSADSGRRNSGARGARAGDSRRASR
jgi:hypothetical protein